MREKKKEMVLSERRYEACPVTDTSAGIPVKPVYEPEDISDVKQEEIGKPGEYPFTRGIWKNMYRGKLWTRRVFTGLGSPSDTNKRYKYLIAHGESGLYCFGDTITHMGIDPDHPLAKGSAGVTGVSQFRQQDLNETFDGIDLENISVSFNNPSMAAAVVYSGFVNYAEDAGFDLKKLSGSILNEPLHFNFSVHPINCHPYRLAAKVGTDLIEYSIKHTPRWHPQAGNPYDLHEKGANAIQEIAFTFGFMREYMDRLIERGHRVDEFAKRMNVMGCACDIDLFEEVAKFRAARKVWAKLMKDKYGAKDAEACRLYLSAHTSGHSLTKQQPANNIIRITLESLACVLGGLQSFDPAGYDEAYYLLTEDSALMSLNAHNILAYEARVANTADPLAGSYYVEWLTSKMEEEMWKLIDKIDEMGGAIKAMENGWVREQLEKELLREEREIKEKKRIIVGLNDFVVPKEEEVRIAVGRDRSLEEQMATSRVREELARKFRDERDNVTTKSVLEDLSSEAEKGEKYNLIDAIKESLRADATMGEILGTIREAFGATYDPLGQRGEYPFK